MNSPSAGDRDLDLRRLRMFVTVVDSPNLRVAADELYITQQALSSAIRELERQMGVTLFSRANRRLVLTEAGSALYDGAVPLLAGGRHLASSVRSADADRRVPFVIGHTPDLAPSEIFRIIEPVVRDDPTVPITVRPVFASDIHDALVGGAIDLAFGRGVGDPSRLASAIATYHVLRLAMHADHPLAQHERVDLEALANHEIVVWGAEGDAEYTDILVDICRRAGFEPRVIVSTLIGTPPHTSVIAHPQACAFVTNAPGWLDNGRIRIVEFTDPPVAPARATWLPNTTSPLRQQILDSLRTDG
ncbi:LysR family transcriptional regulator [Gordonia sp. ABSL49_1]|uniref:LysR family transcriptional regulator n=1 Tax=Gordonia sp. ABSL49_1 TaxID=2920941 RepID=UPI0023F1CAFC|nr:LysR family transcriptional regulator [Gordonia sp. ABSL49_1]